MPFISSKPSPEPRKAHSTKHDVQEVFDQICRIQLTEEEQTDIFDEDNIPPLNKIRMQTVDVQTAIGITLAKKAIKTGDPKTVDVFFKYAGQEPTKKQEIEVKQIPTFVDDIPPDIREMLRNEAAELAAASEKNEDE